MSLCFGQRGEGEGRSYVSASSLWAVRAETVTIESEITLPAEWLSGFSGNSLSADTICGERLRHSRHTSTALSGRSETVQDDLPNQKTGTEEAKYYTRRRPPAGIGWWFNFHIILQIHTFQKDSALLTNWHHQGTLPRLFIYIEAIIYFVDYKFWHLCWHMQRRHCVIKGVPRILRNRNINMRRSCDQNPCLIFFDILKSKISTEGIWGYFKENTANSHNNNKKYTNEATDEN